MTSLILNVLPTIALTLVGLGIAYCEILIIVTIAVAYHHVRNKEVPYVLKSFIGL
jgi:hypothetical protein